MGKSGVIFHIFSTPFNQKILKSYDQRGGGGPAATGPALGYVHTYPGLFENGAFRPRIHRNGPTYPHVSGAF